MIKFKKINNIKKIKATDLKNLLKIKKTVQTLTKMNQMNPILQRAMKVALHFMMIHHCSQIQIIRIKRD